MNACLYIPPHVKCRNCGDCCGPVAATVDEIARIEDFVQSHKRAREVVNAPHEPLDCIFHDDENRSCAIYQARPMVCRLFGVTKGMKCPNGNSAEIDGRPFLDIKAKVYGINSYFKGYYDSEV